MIAPRLVAALALAVLTRASVAAACSCTDPPAFVSGGAMTLGREATLYLFVPTVAEPQMLPEPTATQGEATLVVETEEVARVDGGSVKRVRIAGAAPGALAFAFTTGGSDARQVAEQQPRFAWPHVRSVEHSGRYGGCELSGPRIDVAGDRAAAFRLRWTDDAGKRREAYLPAEQLGDRQGLPIRDLQSVRLGFAGCGVNWLGVDYAPLKGDGRVTFADAELTMLGVDGDETVVLRGVIGFDRGDLTAASFALRPLPPPPPPVVDAPPPAPAPAIVWWRVAAATGGGLTLGGAAGFFAFGRRRRAT